MARIPDLAIVSGRIRTLDAAKPQAEALAVAGSILSIEVSHEFIP